MSTVNANFAIFDGNNLAALVPGLDVLGVDPYKQPKRHLSLSQIARTNKNKTNSAYYNDKKITIRVSIKQANRSAVEQSIDTLNGLLLGLEKELWLPQSGTTRKYYATLSDTNPLRSGGAYWEADLIFTLSDSFGYDTAYTVLINLSNITASSRADQLGFVGSADFQLPFISILYSAANSGGLSTSVSLGNSSTGQTLTISRVWNSGDRLEVDCQAETVKVNGVEVASTGAFPRFAAGLSSLTYADGLTSRTFNYLAYYYKRWV